MPHLPFAAAFATGLLLTGCSTMTAPPSGPIASTDLHFADGRPAGAAQFASAGDRVTVTMTLSGFAEGMHGVHLHMTGACTAPDFTAAGGHLNPMDKQHGSQNPAGKHLGDLPNVTIGSGGTGTLTATFPGPAAEVMDQIFDADGTAIIVHAGADDYRTDPSGDSGGRVACGVVARSQT